jgi:hypothetical protein
VTENVDFERADEAGLGTLSARPKPSGTLYWRKPAMPLNRTSFRCAADLRHARHTPRACQRATPCKGVHGTLAAPAPFCRAPYKKGTVPPIAVCLRYIAFVIAANSTCCFFEAE